MSCRQQIQYASESEVSGQVLAPCLEPGIESHATVDEKRRSDQ
jgi:hypothetical protein